MSFLEKAWRRAGFGYDGAADKLLAKGRESSDQVFCWFTVSNLFCVHHLGAEEKFIREINDAVSNELMLRAHESRIQAYSPYEGDKVPKKLGYARDMGMYYKVADIVDSILSVCSDLNVRQDSWAKVYIKTATQMLGSVDALKDACRSIFLPTHIVDDYYTNIRDAFPADTRHGSNVEAVVNQIINGFRLNK